MKRLSFTITIIALSLTSLMAQTAVDALRYSRIIPGGTARFVSMGGAFGALGGDFSMLSTNPGGIGLYKSSEFTLTPSVFAGSTRTDYRGIENKDYRVNFNLGDIGLVFTKKMESKFNTSGWKAVQFAIGLNRLNDFNNRMELSGSTSPSSILDVYTAYANDNQINYNDIEGDPYYDYAYDLNPAWWTYLLDTLGGPSSYVNPILQSGSNQRMNITSWGSMNEFVIGFGGNYNDKVYIGASFGIPYIRYFEESDYTENLPGPANDMYQFTIHRELETRASGINFKLGLIGRPADWIRIGAAIHTPTFYTNIRDRNVALFDSRFKTPDIYGYTSYFHSNTWTKSYELTTPFRALGSIAFIIGKIGLVSVEYNFTDYSQARFRYVSSYVNDDISNGYRPTHNFKAGTEWRYGLISLRLGYAYNSSPYQGDINDGTMHIYSGGLGFNFKNYFLDLAYAYSKYTEDYYLYSYGPYEAKAVNDIIGQRYLLTFGARF